MKKPPENNKNNTRHIDQAYSKTQSMKKLKK